MPVDRGRRNVKHMFPVVGRGASAGGLDAFTGRLACWCRRPTDGLDLSPITCT